MPERTEAASAPLVEDVRRSWAELTEMFALRRRLAEAELRSDLATSKKLAWTAGSGIVAALTGLSVLVMAVASFADRYWDLAFPWVSTTAGAALIVGGLFFAWASWWNFRRELLGFEQSIAELKEDLVWLREWSGAESDNDEGTE